MILTGVKIAVLSVALVLPLGSSSAAGQSDSMSAQLKVADQTYAGRGFNATGWSHAGSLRSGGSERMTIDLLAGKVYQIVGICDDDCKNLDLVLTNASGKEADADTKDDDVPIVGTAPSSSGTYTLSVAMVKCSSEPCAYAIRAYAK